MKLEWEFKEFKTHHVWEIDLFPLHKIFANFTPNPLIYNNSTSAFHPSRSCCLLFAGRISKIRPILASRTLQTSPFSPSVRSINMPKLVLICSLISFCRQFADTGPKSFNLKKNNNLNWTPTEEKFLIHWILVIKKWLIPRNKQ